MNSSFCRAKNPASGPPASGACVGFRKRVRFCDEELLRFVFLQMPPQSVLKGAGAFDQLVINFRAFRAQIPREMPHPAIDEYEFEFELVIAQRRTARFRFHHQDA